MKSIEVGDAAPEFVATASDGRSVALADFKGKQSVVLFFYPADNSLICTAEACTFRDAYEDFIKAGAVVIGVSGNTDDSHREFAAAHRLPFLLIADDRGTLRQAFGVPNTLFLLPGRVTYVIDREGIVRLKFVSQLFGGQHVEEALQMVRQLSGSTATL